jgi:hypothetical protein
MFCDKSSVSHSCLCRCRSFNSQMMQPTSMDGLAISCGPPTDWPLDLPWQEQDIGR